MPGPSNKKQNTTARDQKKKLKQPRFSIYRQCYHASTTENYQGTSSPLTPLSPSPAQLTQSLPPDFHFANLEKGEKLGENGDKFTYCSDKVDEVATQTPYIHNPGNGPRVRNMRAFLSSYFAQPPSLDQPLCAEFAKEEVLQMLCTVLPEETALVLWYNKSRCTGRICPACQRLYCLGDVLPDLMVAENEQNINNVSSPQQKREQVISGICSPVCFILASFNYPGAIKSTWGHTADEIEDETWDLLNSVEDGRAQGDIGQGLSMLVKMTRLDDLGLGQLCFPEIDFDETPEREEECFTGCSHRQNP